MIEDISIFIELGPNDGRGPSLEQMNALIVSFPELIREGKHSKEIELLRARGDDEQVKRLLDAAVEVGIDIWEKGYSRSGFGATIKRSYDEMELQGCRFIHSCGGDAAFLGEVDYPLSCDPHGVPALAGKPKQKSRMFGPPEPMHPSFFVARGEAKEKLKAANFKGLRFYPIEFKRARSLAPDDKLWAVWSDLILPPMKNLFQTDAGEIGFAKDVTERAKNAGPMKGFLSKPEIHYLNEDLKAFGDFDVALMREPLKIHGTLSPRPVFSQRFRRFVIDELGVPFGGVPVCIDDDDIIPWEGPYPSKWSHLNQRPEWLEKFQTEVSRGKSI